MEFVGLVTGASEGIGRGVALQLSLAGGKIYITGRTRDKLDKVVEEINRRGGKGVALVCDHNQDDQTKAVFAKIEKEDGKLDILVNNAYGGVPALMRDLGTPYWELGTEKWESEMRVGLRSAYICSVLATRLMVTQRSGLIVNISSSGGMRYDVTPLYGVRTAALDRLGQDCHAELRLHGQHSVHIVGLWPGPVNTENIGKSEKPSNTDQGEVLFDPNSRESVEFPGLCVRHLLSDPQISGKSGRVFTTVDIAREFSFLDVTGKMPIDFLSARNVLLFNGNSLGRWVPGWLQVPKFIFTLMQHKF